MKKLIFILIILLSPFVCAAHQVLHVAVAANFFNCCKQLNAVFTKNNENIIIKETTGSSGNIYSQIINGAPYDIFLSADMKYPENLVKNRFADKKSFIKYAKGKLVIWTKRDDLGLKQGIDILKDKSINKIAIANPALAPYGYAAKFVMEKQDLWEFLKDKIVFGENVLQTLQYVDTKNADIGIIPLSLLKTPSMKDAGNYFEIPESMSPPIVQGAVITSKGAANPFAAKYLEFIASKQAGDILRQYGYEIP